MFGPLPALHTLVLVSAALLVCVGIGFWLGAMSSIPIDLGAGLLAGAGAGGAAAFALVHDSHHRQRGDARASRRLS